MPVNVEIKAKARNPMRQRQMAEAIADGQPQLLSQRDTFFRVPSGRLKLREFAPDRGELIAYDRKSLSGGLMASDYSIVTTDHPRQLREMLSAVLGVIGQVIKRRTVFLSGQTRIHFDDVEGLGTFLELEVVLHDGQSHEQGQAIARKIMKAIGIESEDLFNSAYIDLIVAAQTTPK